MDSWPMLARCWLGQWLGFTPEEQAYMTQESERGHPTFIVLGHMQHPIWTWNGMRHGPPTPCPPEPQITSSASRWTTGRRSSSYRN